MQIYAEMQKCRNHVRGKAARPLEARRSPSIGFARIIWFVCWLSVNLWFACWLPVNLPCSQLVRKLSWPFTKLACWLFTKLACWLFTKGLLRKSEEADGFEFCICCFWQKVSASTLRFAFARRFWNQILIWNGDNWF